MDLNYLRLIIGFVSVLVLASISFRFKVVTADGAIGMIVIGTIVFGLGGIPASIPLLFFFISSSLLSKIKSGHKKHVMQFAEKNGPRDIRQVFANGGVAAICLVLFAITGNQYWLVGYLAALSEASADTWATEIGTFRKTKTVSIISLKDVPAGQSGGMSILGTSGAIIGALLTGISGFALFDNNNLLLIILVSILAGFAGSIIDSILGATVQGIYFHPETKVYSESIKHGFVKKSTLR